MFIPGPMPDDAQTRTDGAPGRGGQGCRATVSSGIGLASYGSRFGAAVQQKRPRERGRPTRKIGRPRARLQGRSRCKWGREKAQAQLTITASRRTNACHGPMHNGLSHPVDTPHSWFSQCYGRGNAWTYNCRQLVCRGAATATRCREDHRRGRSCTPAIVGQGGEPPCFGEHP